MHCPRCDFENPEGMKFCGKCAAPLSASQKGRRDTGHRHASGKAETRERHVGKQVAQTPSASPDAPLAERRQLTVMFCDLVDSTGLSAQLDPEELHEVVQAYYTVGAQVVARFDGYIAQYLGDGLLVYFGYPVAHEDDAARAVRAGLGILAELQPLNALWQPLDRARPVASQQPLVLQQPIQVRIGIHTGPVVVGEMGGGGRHEQLALGGTPNIAARVQGIAAPDTLLISAATYRLVAGLFACQALGAQTLRGIATPLGVYQVVGEGEAHSRFEVAVRKGLTPLIGRKEECELLLRYWQRVDEGAGQVVLLSGEVGIGKSRLLQELKEQLGREGATRIEFRCSAYHQNRALYPIIEHLQRVLQFQPGDSPHTKLEKLERMLSGYRFPQADTLPLLASLLSLPQPEGCLPLSLSPHKQEQKTQEGVIAWLFEEAERDTLYCAWEDIHWADPSTLELLTLYLDQIPTVRIFTLLTFRPEFVPPWGSRPHLTQLRLGRLDPLQVEELIREVTGDKALPAAVIRQIVMKTDGVPLFVEELTKMILESELLTEVGSHYALNGPLPPLAIPSTLHDSLMARLDRLAADKEIAQLGATLGREFSYELIQAVSSLDEETLRRGLTHLVDAELVYQRGILPHAQYSFKHVLVQETAYQSLLKSKRQQVHRQIAQVIEERFAATVETQPEFVAHHYTAAGLVRQAVPYWQQAGERAVDRSMHGEAISHLTTALRLLNTLPDTPARAQQELRLHIALGASLTATKGWGAPDVEATYLQAQALCQQVGDAARLFAVQFGLWVLYYTRAELAQARELAEQLLRLAARGQDRALLMEAHHALGNTLLRLGELALAQTHLEHGISFSDPQRYRSSAFLSGIDDGVAGLGYSAWALWHLGYPDQALKRAHEMLRLVQDRGHPLSLAWALNSAAWQHQFRHEAQAAQEQAEAGIALCAEHGFAQLLAVGTIVHSWALAEQGWGKDGVVQLQQGLVALQPTGARIGRPRYLAMLAEVYGQLGQTEEGLSLITQALAAIQETGEGLWEAELYRCKGELVLQSQKSKMEAEAEECFWQAIQIARRQSAKALELRATIRLSRLWQQQGNRPEAGQRLAEIYGWFAEGFDTPDLKAAKALLDELS